MREVSRPWRVDQLSTALQKFGHVFSSRQLQMQAVCPAYAWNETPAGFLLHELSSFRWYGAFVGHVHERGALRLWEIPIPRPTAWSWGRGKSGVDVSVLGATCVALRANRTNSACFSPHSHSHTAQQQGTGVHLRVHVSPLL